MKKLGLISDPHANPEPVAEAMAVFQREQVDAILCAGDIAGYGAALDDTVRLLESSHCQCVLGNHEIWYLEKETGQANNSVNRYLNSLPLIWHEEMAGKRVYMVHASPPDSMMDGIRLLDQEGQIIEAEKQAWTERLRGFDYEVLIVGHTHQVFAEQLGHTLVINPGSSCFNHSCAVLGLPDMQVKWFALSGQQIQRSWNWGQAMSR